MNPQLKIIEDVVHLTCRRALPAEQVCAKAKLTMKQLLGAVAEAEKRGYSLTIREGMVRSQTKVEAASRITVGATKPGRYCVCHISDLHLGCRHCAEDSIVEHVTMAYEEGARTVVSTGDNLDGNKPVLLADQDYVGFESQYERLLRVVKACPPMTWVVIDGNHDGYYSASIGCPAGKIVQAQMRAAGVDWNYGGMCLGRAEIHGADWHLWHPSGGSASKLGVIKVMNDRVQDLDEHVDILAMGHLHKFVTATLDDVLLVAPGTFQRKASEFANRITQSWDIGGCLVRYELDRQGRVHGQSAEFVKAKVA